MHLPLIFIKTKYPRLPCIPRQAFLSPSSHRTPLASSTSHSFILYESAVSLQNKKPQFLRAAVGSLLPFIRLYNSWLELLKIAIVLFEIKTAAPKSRGSSNGMLSPYKGNQPQKYKINYSPTHRIATINNSNNSSSKRGNT